MYLQEVNMALDKVQRTARRQFVSQTRTRALGVDTSGGDERTQLLTSLSRFAQAGSIEANKKQRAEIETRKALGAARAAEDLTKAEQYRHGITDDDVLATKLSYNAIVGQHDTMEAGNSFAEWYQANPEATEEDIASKKTELYKPLFEKYGEDERSLKQISLQVQESQFNLVPVQEKIKSKYREQKNTEALTISIGDMLADPNANLSLVVNEEIPERAKALGLDEFTYKSSLMTEMVNRASNGDSRLLDELKGTNWSKDSVLISKAQSQYDQFTARENSIAIGDALGSIEIENAKLLVPWETTLRKVEALNQKYPNSVSADKVASLKKARDAHVKTEQVNTDMMQVSWNNLFNPDGIPLALDGRYSPEEKKKFIKGLDDIFSKKTEELIAAGAPEADANAEMMKQRLTWSRVNRVKVPLLEENLKGLLSLNPEDYPTSEDLPPFFTRGIQLLQQMDEASVDLYMPARDDKVFAANLRSSLKNRDPYSAFKRAYSVKTNPFKVSSSQRTELIDEVDVRLNDKLDVGFFSGLFGEEDTPDWVKAQLRSRVEEEALLNAYNGMFDLESNAKQSVETVLGGYEKIFNGTFINQRKSVIAQESGVALSNVDKYLASFIEVNKDLIAEETGETEGLDVSNLSFEFNNNGTFILTNRGEQVGGRFLTKSIKEIGDKAVEVDLKRMVEESKSKRERDRQAMEELLEQHKNILNPTRGYQEN